MGPDMEKVLFLAHTESDGSLAKGALEALSVAAETAKALGADLTVGLVGARVDAAANAIAGCGAARFLAVEGAEFGVARYATDVAAVEAIAKAAEATLVFAAETSRFARSLPGAAVRLGGRIETRVTAVDPAGPKVQRWYYRQRMVATLSREQRPWVIQLESGAGQAWAGAAGAATVEKLDVALPALRTKVVGTQPASTGAQTVKPDAELLFVAGEGWTKKHADGQTHVKDAEALSMDCITRAKAGPLRSSASPRATRSLMVKRATRMAMDSFAGQ